MLCSISCPQVYWVTMCWTPTPCWCWMAAVPRHQQLLGSQPHVWPIVLHPALVRCCLKCSQNCCRRVQIDPCFFCKYWMITPCNRKIHAVQSTIYTAYAVVLTKYCLNHCARTCCSLRNVTRCRFTNWRIRCERGGRNVHFLSINLISCRRSRGIVLVMASSVREMDSAGRQWNTEKDLRNVRDFSVKRLPSGSTISVWLNKRDTPLCVCRLGPETLRVLK